MNSSLTSELPRSEKRTLLNGMEEILALASYRRTQTEGTTKSGLRGVTGKSNISDDSLYGSDAINLTEFALLDNTPYAIRRFQSTLGNFYLKQGRLALTVAGEELAESLDRVAGAYFERIVSAVQDGSVSLELLDELVDAFTHQGCFESVANDREQDTLQRTILGVVDWSERDRTVELTGWPSELDICSREHYEYTVSGEQFEDKLRDAVHSNVHHLRRGWCLAILRAHELMAAADDETSLSYDDCDEAQFAPLRSLGRVYYLQGQLAHALRAQLWGLWKHLRREAPEGVPQVGLLTQLRSTPIAAESGAVMRAETTLRDGRMSQSDITRELFRSGRVTPRMYDVTVPDEQGVQFDTLRELRTRLQTDLVGTWRPVTDPEISGRTLIEATENCCDPVETASSRTEAIDALGRLVARSTVQCIAAVEQYNRLTQEDPLLGRYIDKKWGQWHSSLPQTADYIETIGDDTPLSVVARRIFDERVISVHNHVVQDRLGSSSISLVFGTGGDASNRQSGAERTLFAAGGTASPGTGNLRYRDLRRLMRDAGLLTYDSETGRWVPTADGREVIERFRREHE